MENVKINKEKLLSIIKANLEKHKIEYLEAIKAYRVKCADLLSQELEKTISGEEFSTHVSVSKPVSFTKEYDLVIQMLEMTLDSTIELTTSEFQQLVNDEWAWKSSFRQSYMSNSSYIGASGVSGTSGAAGTSGISWSRSITFPEDKK